MNVSEANNAVTVRADREIAVYAEAMRHELAANAHKGDWRDTDIDELSHDVLYHAAKLDLSVRAGDLAGILEHAADVGNCAMMAADRAGALDVAHLTDEPTLYVGSGDLRELVTAWRAELEDAEKKRAAAAADQEAMPL